MTSTCMIMTLSLRMSPFEFVTRYYSNLYEENGTFLVLNVYGLYGSSPILSRISFFKNNFALLETKRCFVSSNFV